MPLIEHRKGPIFFLCAISKGCLGSIPEEGTFFAVGVFIQLERKGDIIMEIGNFAINTSSLVGHFYSLPDEVARGNVFAIVIFLFLLYICIYVIQKLTTMLVFVLKKVFLLIIVSLAFFEFMRMFSLKLAFEGLSTETIVFGAAGFVIGVLAFAIALYVALHSVIVLQKSQKESAQEEEEMPAAAVPVAQLGPEQVQATITATGESGEVGEQPRAKADTGAGEKEVPLPVGSRIREELSVTALKNDKRIGAVITYIIIAEFGVFSSKTIAAPSIETGIIFFCAFILASLIFIRLTYHDYWKGTRHLVAAILIGGFLSIVLGFFWGGIPLEQLLSLNYFASDALVALVTGLALSLFMGSIG